MAQRHEILRTTYHNNNRAPMALLCAPRPQLLTIIDLRSVPEKERESRARAVAGEGARRRFDLSVDPLLRAVLLQLRGDEYFLLLAGHDTAWDDYSAGIAVREITALYNNALGPGRSDLAEKIVQYEQAAREDPVLCDRKTSGEMDLRHRRTRRVGVGKPGKRRTGKAEALDQIRLRIGAVRAAPRNRKRC